MSTKPLTTRRALSLDWMRSLDLPAPGEQPIIDVTPEPAAASPGATLVARLNAIGKRD